MKGSEFIKQYEAAPHAERESMTLQAFAEGHSPPFLDHFVEIVVTGRGADGKQHEIRYSVAPDYLAVGTDEDHVLMPMQPGTAQSIADLWGCIMPTRKMVEQIFAKGTKMTMGAYKPPHEVTDIAKHSALCTKRRLAKNVELGTLVSGHKKDIVITPLLARNPKALAIYGGRWDHDPLQFIQGLNAVSHDRNYVDYSHGVRLVSLYAVVDGEEITLPEVLAGARLHMLLSDEGKVAQARYKLVSDG